MRSRAGTASPAASPGALRASGGQPHPRADARPVAPARLRDDHARALHRGQAPPFLLTALGITFIYTWLFNRTSQSTLIVVLFHAASNVASQWLIALVEQGAVVLPEAGLAGWLISNGWLNVLAYGGVALLLVALTRGRPGRQLGKLARGVRSGTASGHKLRLGADVAGA